MSTPRQRLSEEERHAQILRATITVVARDGFDGATTERIAEQAGVSKGLIWHYFADKSDLMTRAVTETVRGLREQVTADLDASLPAREYVRLMIRRVAGLSQTHQENLRALDQITQSLRAPDGTLAFSMTAYEELYWSHESLFRTAQAGGSFGPFDLKVMAVTFQGAIDMMLAYLDTHPGTDTGEYADALADILLTAMENTGR